MLRPDGAVGMWAIQARTEARPKTPERIVHISTAQTKKNYLLKSPAGLLRNGKRRTGTGRRQRRVWEAWSIRPPDSKPGKSANKDCPPLSMLAAPPRIQRRPFTNKPPTSGRVGRMWSIQAPNAKPECSANKDCPQAFHARRAAANEKQPNEPKRPKSGTPVHHRKRTNRTRRSPEDTKPARTTRSRRDSARISTISRYSC